MMYVYVSLELGLNNQLPHLPKQLDDQMQSSPTETIVTDFKDRLALTGLELASTPG